MSHHEALAASLLSLVSFALASPIRGQAQELDTRLRALEEPEPRVRVVFEGIVVDVHGAPAEGAVVVSSAGGKTVADRSGSYRLAASVPVDARRVRITAVGGAGGTLVASADVDLAGASALARVDPLALASVSACPPSWLPTFGGQPGTTGRSSL